MSGITVSKLAKSWGDTIAASDISFEVPEGTLTVLLGPSGCGKSTTLRLIAGLDSATSGKVLIGDEDVTDLAPRKRNISMVFQSYALFPHLSVAENILFGLKVRGTSKAEYNKRLVETAKLLGLTDLLDRKPSQISGGQQQRVALGRAIISHRPICLMDEPLSNLDAKLRHEMRIELRALQQKLGLTMVYVTHDQAEAISMADQIVLINKGQVEQIASPATLYEKPGTLFTAQFIGTPPMNIIELENQNSNWVIAGSDEVIAPLEGNDKLVLGLRPEEIELIETGGRKASVISCEYLGADTLIDCRIGSNIITVRASGQHVPSIGSSINLRWSLGGQHFFDKDTGQRRNDLGEGKTASKALPREGVNPSDWDTRTS
jgi:sn-glycerol 3-phosphate transport system ATP-binding protein